MAKLSQNISIQLHKIISSTDHHLDLSERNSNYHEFPSAVINGDHTTPIAVREKKNAKTHASQNGIAAAEPNSSDSYVHDTFNGPMSQPEKEVDENDTEDQESTISDLSGLSDLSNLSGQDWKPTTGPLSWVQRQMINGTDPRVILLDLVPKGTLLPLTWSDNLLWRLILNLLSEPRRSKLAYINTLEDAVNLLRACKKIIVLTGAGVSVSCGIPDFRSRNGIYARLSKDYPDLPDPQAMFDIHYFRKDPRPFFKFAKEIYPGQFDPSPSHHFIKLLEKQEKLLRNYSQNIDTLEHAAGIENVITCHGSFATATCTVCGYKVKSYVIKEDIFTQRIPYCPTCPADVEERGIMKPDIVFFGEGLSEEFHEAMSNDKDICDLLIVIGSSLKVRPVAMIPSSIPANVPQILINREPLKHLTFDIELLGDCDVIIGELCRRLEPEWEIDENIPRLPLKEISLLPTFKQSLQTRAYSDNCRSSPVEVNNNNNNSGSPLIEMASKASSSTEWKTNLPQSEESNSCDYRGLSAIKLEDSEDGSNQEQQNVVIESFDKECDSQLEQNQYSSKDIWPSRIKESLSKRLPDANYLFMEPSCYIFQGAEVYKDSETEGSSCTPTDYSSDCESPPRLSSDEDEYNGDGDKVKKDTITCEKQFDLDLSLKQSVDSEQRLITNGESATWSKNLTKDTNT